MQTKRPAGFDHIHRLLGKPMRAADSATWPARPHLGGPLPVLGTRLQLRVGLEVARLLRDVAAKTERKQYDELIAIARRVAGGEELPRKMLQEISKPSKADPPAIKIAKHMARMALGVLYASPSARNMIGTNIENAAITGVKLRDADGVRDLLAAIDQAIMRVELTAALEEREIAPSSEIVRIVSRPKGTTKGLALVMAQLADGNYGLFVKLKNRWDWHEGDRATMFATMPDAFMRAVAADLDPDFKRSRA
jgi:hypothetical protein